MHYIIQYFKHLLENQLQSLDVKAVVHDDYNKRIDEGTREWRDYQMQIAGIKMSGRTAQNWPLAA